MSVTIIGKNHTPANEHMNLKKAKRDVLDFIQMKAIAFV